jgi:hypothetical protein
VRAGEFVRPRWLVQVRTVDKVERRRHQPPKVESGGENVLHEDLRVRTRGLREDDGLR